MTTPSPLTRAFFAVLFTSVSNMATSLQFTRRFTAGELFARARAAEAATGIGNRRQLCSNWLYRVATVMPRSSVAAGAEGGFLGY